MSKVLEALPGDSQRPSVENLRTFAPRPSRAELVAGGEAMRKQCPRSSHAVWTAPQTDRTRFRWSRKPTAGESPS